MKKTKVPSFQQPSTLLPVLSLLHCPLVVIIWQPKNAKHESTKVSYKVKLGTRMQQALPNANLFSLIIVWFFFKVICINMDLMHRVLNKFLILCAYRITCWNKLSTVMPNHKRWNFRKYISLANIYILLYFTPYQYTP